MYVANIEAINVLKELFHSQLDDPFVKPTKTAVSGAIAIAREVLVSWNLIYAHNI